MKKPSNAVIAAGVRAFGEASGLSSIAEAETYKSAIVAAYTVIADAEWAASNKRAIRGLLKDAKELKHYSILADGPRRFVVVDDRTDDPAPVYRSRKEAERALDRIVGY